MDRIILDYGDLVRTPATISGLISGTAFFPGGSGLWRGVIADGKLPEFFPESPIMFVGNYWFNENGFKKALKHGSEEIGQITGFWAAMRAYIRVCGLVEEQCFFTNALMGLTPANGPATGRLTGDGRDFRKQCRAFFDEQVRLVEPKVVVIMGEHAKEELFNFRPKVEVPHPSSLRVKPVDLDTAAARKVSSLLAELHRLNLRR